MVGDKSGTKPPFLSPLDEPAPVDIERDLARIVARALVQQFRRDMTLPVEADHAPDEREANVVLHE